MDSLALHRPTPAKTGLLGRIRAAVLVNRQRKALGTLDDHLLRDLGLDRETALREARRSFWDVPQHWRG